MVEVKTRYTLEMYREYFWFYLFRGKYYRYWKAGFMQVIDQNKKAERPEGRSAFLTLRLFTPQANPGCGRAQNPGIEAKQSRYPKAR